jgi:hypothetical protein
MGCRMQMHGANECCCYPSIAETIENTALQLGIGCCCAQHILQTIAATNLIITAFHLCSTMQGGDKGGTGER